MTSDITLPNSSSGSWIDQPRQRGRFSKDELQRCGVGDLFSYNTDARLPSGPMLVFDSIDRISAQGGEFGRGEVDASFAIHPDLWFFSCHFVDDPVMPGCLILDALWQLLGFYLLWTGYPGRGRALGNKGIRFSGQVLPTNRLVTYHLDVRRVIEHHGYFGIANGTVRVDDVIVCKANDLRTGMFESLS